MTKIKEGVTQLVKQEYALASEQHGGTFKSYHEAYAVMKEEVDEAMHEGNIVEDKLNDDFWRTVKADFPFGCELNAKIIMTRAIDAACEFIQVAAMAYKTLQRNDGDQF